MNIVSRKLIAAVKNGKYDEAFKVHQEALWLVTHKLAKVIMVIMIKFRVRHNNAGFEISVQASIMNVIFHQKVTSLHDWTTPYRYLSQHE